MLVLITFYLVEANLPLKGNTTLEITLFNLKDTCIYIFKVAFPFNTYQILHKHTYLSPIKAYFQLFRSHKFAMNKESQK